MRVRLGKYFRLPGGAYLNVSTSGGRRGKKPKKSASKNTGKIAGIVFLVLLAIGFYFLAWIPAIIAIIVLAIRQKRDGSDKLPEILFCALIAVTSLGMMIYAILSPSLDGIEATWPEITYTVGDTVSIEITTEPEGMELDDLELCYTKIAEMTWDGTTATVTFTDAGTDELYFVANDDIESTHTEITVVDIEEPEEEVIEEVAQETEESAEEVTEEPAEEAVQETTETTETAAATETQTATETETESTSEMVWVSSSGSKYHRIADCSGMTSATQITLEEAISRGREACNNCY